MQTDLVFIESGRRRKGEHANCACCGAGFIRRASHSNGKKIYCSPVCSSKGQATRQSVSCATCGKGLLRTPSRLSVSTSGLSFCNKTCLSKAQQIVGGSPAVHPPQYGTANSQSSYKVVAFRHHAKKCVNCGITFAPLLVVHHIDGDRSNNVPENLEILCHNHHGIRHMVWRNEKWHYSSSAITPRDKIEEICKSFDFGGIV